jgi:hypothetical protein
MMRKLYFHITISSTLLGRAIWKSINNWKHTLQPADIQIEWKKVFLAAFLHAWPVINSIWCYCGVWTLIWYFGFNYFMHYRMMESNCILYRCLIFTVDCSLHRVYLQIKHFTCKKFMVVKRIYSTNFIQSSMMNSGHTFFPAQKFSLKLAIWRLLTAINNCQLRKLTLNTA